MANEEAPDSAAAEVRKLRYLIIGIVVVLILAGVAWWQYTAAQDRGKKRADCVVEAIIDNRPSDNC
jgi:hypothetical protein